MVALRALGSRGCVIVDEVDLAADDGLHAVLGAGVLELHRPVHHPVISQPQRRLLELGRPRREVLDLARPIEQRILGVHVQMGAGL